MIPNTLLVRAFVLIALLILASLGVSLEIYRSHQRGPIAGEIARQTVSIVNITRSAIVNADPRRRLELLIELNETEGIRVLPAAPSDVLAPVPRDPLFDLVGASVKAALGPGTRLAFARNDVEGYWVSFRIDEDEFWVMLGRERLEPDLALQWLGWGIVAMLLSLIGAWLIATRISGPLAALTRNAQRVGRGERPEPAPEDGPREIATLAVAFNQMSADLGRLERERATVLAGISHDLRTPLARLRLGLEMMQGDNAMREGLAGDIEDMDKIIGQFLAYARGENEAFEATDIDALATEVVARYARQDKPVSLNAAGHGAGRAPVAPMALRRAVANLVDNALRYAGTAVEVSTLREDGFAVLEVCDRGPGIPEAEAERMKLPFTRMENARSDAGGSGLGLAIVERIARMHGGRLELLAREGGGLRARLSLMLTRPDKDTS